MVLNKGDGDFWQGCDADVLVQGSKGNGVITGFAVSALGTPAMTVNVGSGRARVDGTYVQNTSTQNVTIPAAHASQKRYDLIYIDTNGSAANDSGSPSATTPNVVDLSSDNVGLAAVVINSGDTEINTGDIRDIRIEVGRTFQTFYSTANWTGDLSHGSALSNFKPIGMQSVLIDEMDTNAGWTVSSDGALASGAGARGWNTDNLTVSKSGTGDAFVSIYKTYSDAQDISGSETDLELGVWIEDAPTYNTFSADNAIQIRYGNDSDNYYQWNFARSNLTEAGGVNLACLCCMQPFRADVTGGTPTDSNMTYVHIQFNFNNASDTIGANNLNIDDLHLTEAGILRFESLNGGDFEFDMQAHQKGAEGARVALYIDGDIQSDSVRAQGETNSPTQHNIRYHASGLDVGSHVVKVLFHTDGAGSDNPIAGTNGGVNYLSARELILN
jgi:hypothetical protein